MIKERFVYRRFVSVKDEYKQLKKENEDLKKENEKLIQKKCLPCELVSLQTREIDELKDENEQLKQEIRAYPINEQYAEEIMQQNQELRIERNDLRRENEQLQARNKYNLEDCNMEIAELRKENEQLQHKLDFQLSLAETKIKNREKENEQLRQKIKKVSDMLDEIDYFSANAVTHDTIAYREMMKFDNKDAYYFACNLKDAVQILRDVNDE